MFRYKFHLNSIHLQEIGIGIIWHHLASFGSIKSCHPLHLWTPGACSGCGRQRIGGRRHPRCPGTVHDDPRGVEPLWVRRLMCSNFGTGKIMENLSDSGSQWFTFTCYVLLRNVTYKWIANQDIDRYRRSMFLCWMFRCKPAYSDFAILLVRIRTWPMFLHFSPKVFLSINLEPHVAKVYV
jgi:hypothetical protein